ncbi:MAG: ORF6N domain-containing protein, partial [Desulfobacterales bacterium]
LSTKECRMIDNKLLVPVERVEKTILLVRGQKVILDADLAKLYGVTTKRLNQQVKRNSDRFPEDFMFRLTQKEKNEVVANCNHLSNLRFSPALPHALTEHGALMAASVVNTPRAIESSIFVVRAFVRLRQIMATHKELARKLLELERHLKGHDQQIQAIFEAIHQLMTPPEKPKRKIGFTVKEKQKAYGKKRKSKRTVKKSQKRTL